MRHSRTCRHCLTRVSLAILLLTAFPVSAAAAPSASPVASSPAPRHTPGRGAPSTRLSSPVPPAISRFYTWTLLGERLMHAADRARHGRDGHAWRRAPCADRPAERSSHGDGAAPPRPTVVGCPALYGPTRQRGARRHHHRPRGRPPRQPGRLRCWRPALHSLTASTAAAPAHRAPDRRVTGPCAYPDAGQHGHAGRSQRHTHVRLSDRANPAHHRAVSQPDGSAHAYADGHAQPDRYRDPHAHPKRHRDGH